MTTVLIIEDEAALASAIAILVRRLGHEALTAASATLGLQKLQQQRPSLVVLDIGLPDLNGLQALARIRVIDAAIPVLIVTAHGNLQNAVEARKGGAAGYLVKPLDLAELERTIRSLLQAAEALPMALPAQLPPSDEGAAAPLLIGSCAAMQPAFSAIAHACASDAPVLITGPTGIGKSLTARVIHLHSARHQGPFVTLSCASLPEGLLEAELFGHEKGAFSGAHELRIGHLDRAAGGTLFLDEIGEIPLAAQVKLLRFVEEKTFVRVGGREDQRVDLRILAATNRDLLQAVAEKRFREDLLYRLRVLEVQLPPLAQRRSDIPGLAAYLLAGMARGREVRLSQEAADALQQHAWPGNVRELRNVLERAVAQCRGSLILGADLPPELQTRPAAAGPGAFPALDAALQTWLDDRLRHPGDYAALVEELESRVLGLLLPRYDHKPTHLARALNIHRATLRKRLRERDGPEPTGEA
ncbi:MAG: sigma-54 dependent transcriptional regulator [Planctomycetes bacterium]|jgi:DNA-binding NtrC family response regulator|nr:sigma-54 dependent transcriptional regulator [Planctomycetota bacterium]